MSHWYPGNPAHATHLDRARQARAEALARAAYLVIDGVARLAGGTGRAVATATRAAATAIRRRRRRRAALRTLRALDDRTLKDIGLRRADLPWIVDNLPRSPAHGHAPIPAETGAVETAQIRPGLAA